MHIFIRKCSNQKCISNKMYTLHYKNHENPIGMDVYTLDFPGSSTGKESTCNGRPLVDSWVRKIPWRRDRLPTPVYLGFPDGSVGKESACNVGDLGSVPGLGRSPGGEHGNPL